MISVGNLQAEIIDRDGAARVVIRRVLKDDHGDLFGESRPSKDTIGIGACSHLLLASRRSVLVMLSQRRGRIRCLAHFVEEND